MPEDGYGYVRLFSLGFQLLSRLFYMHSLERNMCCYGNTSYHKTDGMQYHLVGKERTDHTYTDRIRPRVQKHDYQIAMFGGSEAQTCQLFNPKGNKNNHMILI